ncbi:MAG: large subunit ribosomal protein L19 [Thalassomonas sp.]
MFLRIIKLKNIRNIANRFRNLIIRKMNITETIAKELTTGTELPNFKSGDNITVYYTIKEGDKQRTQFFKGDVIQRKGSGATETFTIRKISHSIGVERIFPINSPLIEKIEVNKKGKVRRARIYYLRELTGKKARIREAR